jgi:hypothetical protein
LLLSSVVASSEAAMALTPIALIPQVVLGGLMVPVTTNALLKIPMMTMPSRWGFEGMIRSERVAVSGLEGWKIPLADVIDSPPDYIAGGVFECALAQMESSQLSGGWGFHSPQWLPSAVLAGLTLVILTFVVLFLGRKD